MSSLLADIVASRNLQPEPVATDALVYLLARTEAGRRAFAEFFNDVMGEGAATTLTFTAQVTGSDGEGRPDIVGSDGLGPRLIVEAKFDAELTPIQKTAAYEDRLTQSAPGAVLFLVPADRLVALWVELLEGPGHHALAPVFTWPEGAKLHACELPKGNRLAATSWEHLLPVLRHALAVAGDTAALEDLAQLEGLVAWRGRVGWTPLAPGDLPVRAGRQISELIPAVLGAAQAVSVAKLRNGSADQGPGRYLTTGSGHTIWAGLYMAWWGRYGHSPAWAQVKAGKVGGVDLIAEALAGLPEMISRPSNGDVLVPLRVPYGAEIDTVTRQLVHQLQEIAVRLEGLPSAAVAVTDPPSDLLT